MIKFCPSFKRQNLILTRQRGKGKNFKKNQITRNITVRECIFPYPGMGSIRN